MVINVVTIFNLDGTNIDRAALLYYYVCTTTIYFSLYTTLKIAITIDAGLFLTH